MTGPRTAAAGARLAVLAIAVAVLLCWVWTFRGHGHDWGGDFSLYIAHARNIALGRDYNAVNYIPEKLEKGVPLHGPPSYPPGFPLILAPVYRLAGLDYGPMRALVQVLWLVSGVLFYLHGKRRGLPPLASAAAAGVFLLSTMVLNIKDSVLSESTYLVISVVALLFFERIYNGNEADRRPFLYGTLAGLLILAAYLTRVTGIALVAAFTLYELYRTRRIRTFAVAAGAVFLAGFVLYRLTLYDGGGYANQFRFTPGTWVRNGVDYLKSPASLWGSVPAVLRYPASVVVLIVAVTGFVRKVRSALSVAEFYVLLYMVPLLLYSSGANSRYIVPVYPLVLLYCAEGLIQISLRVPVRARRPAFAALGGLLAAGAAANVVVAIRAPEPDGPEIPSFRQAAAWLRSHSHPGEVVVSWNPRVVALYTERPSAFYPTVPDPVLLGNYLDELHAKWVLTFSRSESDAHWLSPYAASHPERFEPVLRNADFVVYRVRRGSDLPSFATENR
jgi:hypothetical protein